MIATRSIKPKKKLKSGRKAVFLDRDGTIIKQVELMHSVEELKLLPGAAQAIGLLNKLGFLVVVVTNQPVVARGIVGPKEIDNIHAVLIERLGGKGAKVDAIYFCPHHPEATMPKYRLRCHCRKPRPGMILKGLKKLNINPKKSFMVGDALIDVVAGKKAGLKTILVKTGPGHARLDEKYKDIKPDFTVKNLLQMAKVVAANNF
ncbi:MAG TPA: HAD family hydrolase [Candidatus Udaeobacter sp.]|nr:HAD family hydrolase [Candidatus Udaeobacter sp.]